MYFTIYLKDDTGLLKIEELNYIDISNIELYELKRKITKIEEDFEIYKLTHPGSYTLIISNDKRKE